MKDAMQAVAHRNNFYQDRSDSVMIVLLLSMLINVVLAGLIYYVFTNPPETKYIPTSVDGRIQPLSPLNSPYQSDAAVLQWASTAAVEAFSYDFVNYRAKLQSLSGNFTKEGWQQFMSALSDSNNLAAVRAKKLIVSSVVKRAPVILEKGILPGTNRYAWKIELPLLVSYQSASEFEQNERVILLTVNRVSTLNFPRGIGISQFIVKQELGA